MLVLYISVLALVVSNVWAVPPSSCQDLDATACALFSKAKPDLCDDETFSLGSCQRFCGNCPLECFACPSPVLNPNDCNTTLTCARNQTCMTKHLHALDGHDEYIFTCEQKTICDGFSLGFAFGKRDVIFEEESEDDIEDHGSERSRRDVSISCCDTDFCNTPMTTTTLPPTSPGPFPNGCNRDIIFVVDDSGSVGSANFKHSLDFVKSVINEINVGPTAAQVGLLTFSTHAQTGWYLNTFSDKQSMYTKLSQLHYLGGVTHTDEALDTVRTQLLTFPHGDRPNNENVVIVLTDGQSNNHAATVQAANNLHTVSKDVISIVVGQGINANELNGIATDRHHVFDIRTYGALATILPNVMQVICNA